MSAAERVVSAPIPHIFGELNIRQARFLDYYLELGNGTEAARRAGYAGNSDELAVVASRLLRVAKVQQELRRRLKKHIASADEVLEGLTSHARSDIANVLEPDGSFDIRSAKRRGVSKLLRKLKVKTRYERDAEGNAIPIVEHEFELHDAQSALKTLAQYHGLLIERTQSVNVNIDLAREDLLNVMQQAMQDVDMDAVTDTEGRSLPDPAS